MRDNYVHATSVMLCLAVACWASVGEPPMLEQGSQDTLYVYPDQSGSYSTIQAAIDAAGGGAHVILASGTYTGEGNRDIDFCGKAIVVRSVDPNDPSVVAGTIIDCEGSHLERHRGVHFHSGEDPNSVLSGITIQNGYQEQGGGILCSGSSPTIQKCRLVNNTVVYPGEGGAGIACINHSDTQILQCYIADNYSETTGGGIECEDYCTPLIADCRIEYNESAWDGGGICCDNYSPARIVNCTFNYNTTGSNGGAIYCEDQSGLSIRNTLLVGNETIWYEELGGGSAISCEYSDVTIDNCTIAQNTANVNGTIDCFGRDEYGPSHMRIMNTIVWDNTPEGSEITLGEGDYPTDESTLHISYSDIEGGLSSCLSDENTEFVWGPGNIESDPLFAPESGDYHLQSAAGRWHPSTESWADDQITSPCIDAGSPGCVLGKEPEPRGSRINMGAYGGTLEASKSPEYWRNIADLTNDWVVDVEDLCVWMDHWLDSGICMPSDLNRDHAVTLKDFRLLADNWLRTNPSRYISEIAMETGIDYGDPDLADDTQYEFNVEIAADTSVQAIEFAPPAGGIYGMTETSPGQWEYEANFSSIAGFEGFGDGEYVFTIALGHGFVSHTTVWFAIPGTGDPIPQPTQIPTYTSFSNGASLVSPVTLSWEACNAPDLYTVNVSVVDTTTWEDVLDEELPGDVTELGEPVPLELGQYEIDLSFDIEYATTNADGITMDLAKWCESDYWITVEGATARMALPSVGL